MGLEIEFEYDDSPDGTWSPVVEAPPARELLSRGQITGSPSGNPLIVHFGIALAALALGAASMAGYLVGRTAANNRTVTILHLAPTNSFTVQPLPLPPAQTTQSPDQLLAAPWTNAFDRDVSLSVINDGPEPVTVLGATISSLDFDVTQLIPASTAPTASGGVSLLRGRASVVCGDFPAGRTATIANLLTRTADGTVRRETLMVDRFSGVVEQAVCARMPAPQIVRSTTFAPAPPPAPVSSRPHSPPANPTTYVVNVVASNRAPFPLRMSLPQSAAQSWAGAGLLLSTPSDIVIPPGATRTITISAAVTDCPAAQAAATGGYNYDALDFSDARDPVSSGLVRLINQDAPLTDLDAIMKYCLTRNTGPGGNG